MKQTIVTDISDIPMLPISANDGLWQELFDFISDAKYQARGGRLVITLETEE